MSKITGIDLYCCECATCAAARQWLDDHKIPYNYLFYANEQVHPKEQVLAPLRTWSFAEGPFNATDFPFVTFLEKRPDIDDPRKWPLHFLAGPDFSSLLPWMVD